MCVEDEAPEVQPKLFTLLMVVRDGSVLLGEKKRGFGAGYFNGFGKAEVQVDNGLTPRVESAWCFNSLKVKCFQIRWFQISTCTPSPRTFWG